MKKARWLDPIEIRQSERLVARLRPSWRHYARFLPFPIGMGVFIGRQEIGLLFIPFVPLVFLVILSRYSNLFLITTHRVLQKTGLIARRTAEVDLPSIQLIKAEQGIIDRLLGTGRVIIESAGQNGGKGDVVLGGIADPVRIKELLFRLKNKKGLKNRSSRGRSQRRY
jgi:uncharacterized membrane protein YdbT with pleckstrin-like domain